MNRVAVPQKDCIDHADRPRHAEVRARESYRKRGAAADEDRYVNCSAVRAYPFCLRAAERCNRLPCSVLREAQVCSAHLAILAVFS